MMDLDEKKKQEIDSMVTVLKQLDLTGIQILTMNANTLLALKMENARKNGLYPESGRKGPADERKLA